MLKRSLLVLTLAGVLTSAAATAQPADHLLFHKRMVGQTRVTQLAALIPVPAPAPGVIYGPEIAALPLEAQPLAVAVRQYLSDQGFLINNDNVPFGIKAIRTGGGWVIHVSAPGINIDIVVHAPGPIIMGPDPRTFVSTVITDIYNGF